MVNKKYTVMFSDKATSMLIQHVRFLASVSPSAAEKLHREIIKEAKALEFMPESYPWLNAEKITVNKYRKKLVAKRYLLIYQIKDNIVYVDYVVDCRQDYKWLI